MKAMGPQADHRVQNLLRIAVRFKRERDRARDERDEFAAQTRGELKASYPLGGQGTVVWALVWLPSRNAKVAAKGKPPCGHVWGRRSPVGW